jgi:hypothetical protein
MSILNVTIHVLNALIGCLCIVILGLVAHSASQDVDVPPGIKGTSSGLIFWPGVGGIVDALLFLFLWAMKPSEDGSVSVFLSFEKQRSLIPFQMKKRTISYNALLFVASFIFGRPLIVLIYTFVEHDLEDWACAQTNATVAAHSTCTDLRAARFIQIPVLVLSTLFMLLVFWIRYKFSQEKKATGPNLMANARNTPMGSAV